MAKKPSSHVGVMLALSLVHYSGAVSIFQNSGDCGFYSESFARSLHPSSDRARHLLSSIYRGCNPCVDFGNKEQPAASSAPQPAGSLFSRFDGAFASEARSSSAAAKTYSAQALYLFDELPAMADHDPASTPGSLVVPALAYMACVTRWLLQALTPAPPFAGVGIPPQIPAPPSPLAESEDTPNDAVVIVAGALAGAAFIAGVVGCIFIWRLRAKRAQDAAELASVHAAAGGSPNNNSSMVLDTAACARIHPHAFLLVPCSEWLRDAAQAAQDLEGSQHSNVGMAALALGHNQGAVPAPAVPHACGPCTERWPLVASAGGCSAHGSPPLTSPWVPDGACPSSLIQLQPVEPLQPLLPSTLALPPLPGPAPPVPLSGSTLG